jgi:hypothetical protein
MASETPTYDKLKWRLKKFVDAFIDTGIGAEAMRRTGYTGPRADMAAYRLRQKPGVAQAIAERQRLAIKVAGGTSAEVLDVVWDTLKRCRQVTPVLDRFGKPVMVETADGSLAPAFTFDAKNALKAAELLGKYHKLWTERHEHTGLNGGPIETKQVDDLTDDQLEAIASRGRPASPEPETSED